MTRRSHRIPPEEDGPLKKITFKYGIFVIIALVLLRLSIGWHFFKEGAKKFTHDFSAESFLVISEGPLAGLYKGMISDAFGDERLDRDKTVDAWKIYLNQAAGHYGFAEDQRTQAEDKYDKRVEQLDWFFEENASDLDEYYMDRNWLDEAQADSSLRDVEHRWKQIKQKERELRADAKKWMAEPIHLSEDFARDLHAVATPDQQKRGIPGMADAGSMTLINTMVKWTVVLVGVFLLLGLCTRFWSIIGVGFLCSVISSQWPGWTGAADTYYQVVELAGLLVLASTNAGRFAGLDFFLDVLYQGYRAKVTQGTNNGSQT